MLATLRTHPGSRFCSVKNNLNCIKVILLLTDCYFPEAVNIHHTTIIILHYDGFLRYFNMCINSCFFYCMNSMLSFLYNIFNTCIYEKHKLLVLFIYSYLENITKGVITYSKKCNITRIKT